MRIKISWLFATKALCFVFCGVTAAKDTPSVDVVTLPAEVRMPEGLLVPSSELIVRSNENQEFTEQDADESVVFNKIPLKNPVDDMIANGTIVTLEQAQEQLHLPLESHQPQSSSLPENLNNTVETQFASQWVVNTDHQEYLSLNSKEARAVIDFVQKSCADTAAVTKFSLSGRDVLAFLTMVKRHHFDPVVIDVGLRKFYNTSKGCMIIDDVVLHQILPELASVLGKQIDYEKNASATIGMVQRDVEQLMCECFMKYSHMLSDRVNDFITKLSRVTARTAYQALESDENPLARMQKDRERLRQLTIKYVDLLLDRVAWAPHAFESIWPSFMKLGSYVHDLAQKNVITHMDDFKDLYTTLVNRFVFYINLHATALPSDFFRVVQNDLATGVVFFLEYPDHADLKKHLEAEVGNTMFRSMAFERMELAHIS